MEGRQFSISITAGTVFKTILILAVAWLLFELRALVLNLLAAVVIASAIEPGVRGLRRFRVPRVLGVIIVYLLLFSVFFTIFYFFFPLVLEDFATFIAMLPSYIDAATRAGALDSYAQLFGLPAPSLASANDILSSIRGAFDVGGTFSNAFTAIGAIFGGFFSFFLIVIFSFYFAVIETGVDDFLRIIIPKRHQGYALDLWKRSQTKIGLWMQGQLILGVLMGVLIFLGLSILQVPNALFLALIAAVFEIIPVFGPTLAAVPAVLVAFAAGGPTLGFMTIGLYVIAQQFENHLIYPNVVTRIVGVPPLLVILALIAGGQLAGFLGVILAVPIAAIIQELAKDIESGRLGKEVNHA